MLRAKYEAEYAPNHISLKQFCLDQDPPLHLGSTLSAFNRERKRARLSAFHERNPQILLIAQQVVKESLTSTIDPTPSQSRKADFALRVVEKISEREEPNAALAQQVNVVIPPLFPDSALAQKTMAILTGKALPAPSDVPKGEEEEPEPIDIEAEPESSEPLPEAETPSPSALPEAFSSDTKGEAE